MIAGIVRVMFGGLLIFVRFDPKKQSRAVLILKDDLVFYRCLVKKMDNTVNSLLTNASIWRILFTGGVDLEINNVSVVSYYCSYVAMDMKQEFDKRLAKIAKGASFANDYNLKRRFELHIIGVEHKLIRKRKNDKIRQIAALEDMFFIIRNAHSHIGHCRERKTFWEIQKKWANVTMEICKIDINFCEDCCLKRKKKIPKGLVVKPIVSMYSIMSSGQVNLITYQTLPDGKLKLVSKRNEEVAHNLFDVFLLIKA
ncbi:SCAN domain-containing protein 3 [Trichinella papuae]|uniref:SCAN domain-containing protein 3 n=1 Tax=Trichinella papuae TaxID=268474 RepID=A0A0V1MI98_9BILA|nr:SCAN domain-containing protein 3 [Trichinella papuae]